MAMNRLQQLGPTAKTWFLPAPSSLRLISLGFDQLLADFLWLQFIQYIGDTTNRLIDKSRLAAPMLDAITTLDPHFVRAYFFVATVIGGDQHDPQLADRLLNRGIQANSNDWYIPFIAGVNQYLFAHDELPAAKYYQMAAKFPDAPSWLSGQAVILKAHIPSFIKSINVWQKVFDSAEDPNVKQRARDELCALWVHVRDHAPPKSSVRIRAEQELERLGVEIFRQR